MKALLKRYPNAAEADYPENNDHRNQDKRASDTRQPFADVYEPFSLFVSQWHCVLAGASSQLLKRSGRSVARLMLCEVLVGFDRF